VEITLHTDVTREVAKLALHVKASLDTPKQIAIGMRNISYLLHIADHPPKLLNLLPIGKFNDCRRVGRSLGYPHYEPYHEAVKRVVAGIVYFACKTANSLGLQLIRLRNFFK
jgi:hypothetical protein